LGKRCGLRSSESKKTQHPPPKKTSLFGDVEVGETFNRGGGARRVATLKINRGNCRCMRKRLKIERKGCVSNEGKKATFLEGRGGGCIERR